VALALGVVKILLMDIERSRIEMHNLRLIQRVAILEADIKALQREQEKARDEEPGTQRK